MVAVNCQKMSLAVVTGYFFICKINHGRSQNASGTGNYQNIYYTSVSGSVSALCNINTTNTMLIVNVIDVEMKVTLPTATTN